MLGGAVSTCELGQLVESPTPPTVTLAPVQLVDSAPLGSAAPHVISIQVTSPGPGAPSWTLSRAQGSAWLLPSSTSGSVPASLDVSLVPVGLSMGVHQDTLIATVNGSGGQSTRMPVRFSIYPCPEWAIAPDTTVEAAVDNADCGAPHRSGRFAKVYRFDAGANDSISARLSSSAFGAYLVLDSAPQGDALAESGTCPAGDGTACLRYVRLPRAGSYLVAATTADSARTGAFALEVTRPRPPVAPAGLGQLRRDGATAVATGATVPDTVVVLRGTLADPDQGDLLRLEVEVRAGDAPFTGTPTDSSAQVAPGAVATVTLSDLEDDLPYRWRARTRDHTGRAGPWVEFGGNPANAPDFMTAVPEAPSAPSPLQQLKADAATAIAVGATTDERSVVIRATLSDPDPGDALRLEVEIHPVGASFTGTPTAASPVVATGATASVAIAGLADDTTYHWQARAVDASGLVSPWVSFGANAETAPDFRVAVPATHVAFVLEPTDALPGGTISPVEVEVREASGQRDLTFSGSVATAIASGTGTAGAVLSGTLSIPVESGVARFGDLSIDQTGTGYRLVASASGLTSATSAAFNVSTGSAARLTFSVEPTGITAGAVVNPAIRVSALDAFGNVVTNFTGSVSLTLRPGTGTPAATLLGTATLNAMSGVATFSTISIDSAGTGYRLIATSASVPTPDTSVAFDVGPGAATVLTLTGVADPVTAGVASSVTLTARDAFGNVATGYLGTVRFTASDPQAALPADYTFVAGDAGVRAFPGGVTLRSVGERSVTATDVVTSSIAGTQGAITVQPAQAATLSVTGIADPMTAGVASGVTVTARDPFGNVATGYLGTIRFTSSDPAVTLPADYTYLAGDGGIRSFPVGVTLETAGEQTVTATDNAAAGITGSQAAITVQPAAPATLTFSVQPTDVTAGSLIDPPPRVTAFDPFGNVATGYTGTITISLTDGTGTSGAVLSGDLVEDAVNGVATFGTLSINLAGLDYQLDATDAGLPAVTSLPFDVAPGAANHLAFTTQPVTTTAGATMATVRVSVLDGQNNVVPGATEPITLAIAQGTGTSGATLESASLPSPPTVTPVNGVATFTDLFIETGGTGYRLRALASGMTAALSNLFNITAAAPAAMTVSAGAGQTAPVGTAVAIDPAIRIADQFNNGVPNVSVTFAPSGTGAVAGSPALTNATGVATLGSWTLGRRAATNSDTLTASAAGVSSAQLVASATVGPADTLRAVSATTLAGTTGTQAAPAPTVIVVDRFGNPVPDVSVTFTPSAGSVSPNTPVATGANGQASVNWTYGNTTDPQTLTATVGGLIGSPVTFTATVSVPNVTLSVDQASLLENGSDGLAVVTATLSAVSGQVVTVDLEFTGTAIPLGDYDRSATQIVIPAGSLTGSVSLSALPDALDEASETIVVAIASVTNGTEVGTQQVTVTILDDDATPTVAFSVASQSVDEIGSLAATVTVQLSAVSGQAVTVPFTLGGTASGNGTDYSVSASPLVILAGSAGGAITVTIEHDLADEPNETVLLTLGDPTNATLGATTVHTVTITDNDAPPTVTLGTSTTVLPETGGSATLTATVSARSGFDVTVALGFSGTAMGGGTDYTVSGAPIVIPAGSLTGTATVNAAGDLLDEPNESIIVDITGVTNGTESGTQQLTLTITDDDGPPAVQFTAAAQSNDEAVTTVTATVQLSAPSGLDVTVPFTLGGTAASPADYSVSGSPVVIAAGATSGTITITVVDDALDEADETVVLTLGAPTNAELGAMTAHTATITDDDGTPTLSINDVTVTEGAAPAMVNAVFTVTLSAASGQTVTVNYATANGTATAPGDYTAIGTTQLTFAPGVTAQTVTVVVQGDALDEGASEQFTVNLSSPSNATIADGQGVGTITDDDEAPSLSIDDVTVTEGAAAATVNAVFTVTLSAASGQTVTVNYGTSDGTAVAPGDYTAIATTPLTFAPGVTTQPVTVVVQGDALDEADETFTVNLETPVNATIADGVGLGTITDDDGSPTLSINDVTVTEGAAPATVNAVFTVTLSAASGQTVTVNYATANGTAGAPGDYTAIAATTLTFAPGVITQPVTVVVQGDDLDEADETFTVNLSSPGNATIADGQGVGTITDDDAAPTVAFTAAAQSNAENVAAVTATVQLSAVSGQDVTVPFTVGGSATGGGTDYSITASPVVITAGNTTATITITVVNDALDEADETVVLTLGAPTNAGLGTATVHTATITDNDAAPTVTLAVDSTVLGESGTGPAVVTATLSAASGLAVTVDLGFTGTATLTNDYARSGTQIAIPAGSTTGSITLNAVPDVLDEANETVIVDITGVTNGTEVGTQQVTTTITDDDAPPTVTLAVDSTVLGESGTGPAVVTATLSAASGLAVTVDLGFTGTATPTNDYTRSGIQIAIPAGSRRGASRSMPCPMRWMRPMRR